MFSPLLAQAGRKHVGTADIFLTFFCLSSLFIVWDIVKDKKYKRIWLLVLIVALASQVKQEGLFLISLILFLPLKRGIKFLAIFLSLIPTMAWILIRIKYNILADFSFYLPSDLEIFRRAIDVGVYVFYEMLNIRNWYIFWVDFWLLIIVQKDTNNVFIKIIKYSGVLMVFMFFFVYIFANIETKAFAASSVDRVMLQLSPLFYSIFVDRTKLLKERIIKS